MEQQTKPKLSSLQARLFWLLIAQEAVQILKMDATRIWHDLYRNRGSARSAIPNFKSAVEESLASVKCCRSIKARISPIPTGCEHLSPLLQDIAVQWLKLQAEFKRIEGPAIINALCKGYAKLVKITKPMRRRAQKNVKGPNGFVTTQAIAITEELLNILNTCESAIAGEILIIFTLESKAAANG